MQGQGIEPVLQTVVMGLHGLKEPLGGIVGLSNAQIVGLVIDDEELALMFTDQIDETGQIALQFSVGKRHCCWIVVQNVIDFCRRAPTEMKIKGHFPEGARRIDHGQAEVLTGRSLRLQEG